MSTLKSFAIGIFFAALFIAMLVGSAMDIGRLDPFTGGPEQDREFCGNTPPSMLNENELQRCAWIREEDEHPTFEEDDEPFTIESGSNEPDSYDGP